MINDITIIIPTRAQKDYLAATINSIRSKKAYDNIKILIGADNPTAEVRDWLHKEQKGRFDFIIYEPPKNETRLGIVRVVENLIEKVNTKFIYYMHDDMIIGEQTIPNLLRVWKPKRILSSFRIEPPIYPQTIEKLILPLGLTPKEFNDKEFLSTEKTLCSERTRFTVNGFFAPHFFAKDDWVGYDHLFIPQSREDSDLATRWMSKGYELLTVWDSIVYHFSGKGSRKKEGSDDSNEWLKTNYKNTKNYIRKHGTIKHTEHILPVIAPKIPISAHVLVGNDNDLLESFIEATEHYFDEMIFVIDTGQPKPVQYAAIKIINDYVDKVASLTPTNFLADKIKVFQRSLNNDFAAQTNFAISKCQYEWVMKLDVDEQFPTDFLNQLRTVIEQNIRQNPNITVIGFPRINLLDGKVVNDIPRQHWFTEDFHRYPVQTETVKNPDVQFRLHHRSEAWVNPVHEVPESVRLGDIDRFIIEQEMFFLHPKTRDKQYRQEQHYQKILGPKKTSSPIKKIVYDSVIYTFEGITQHAREEIKAWDKRNYQLLLLDNRYREGFGSEFKNFYEPIDFTQDDYVTIVNQPPVRWEATQHFKNRYGYLAFEGKLPKDWVQIINDSNIKELWVPSTYCLETFKESGVQKPLVVVPHGIDPVVWKPIPQELPETFTFLAVGTAQNSRKGLDLLVKAFSQEFKPEENVRLIIKANMIYNPQDSFNDYISSYVDWTGNTNIEYFHDNLTEDEMVKLFNSVHVYVSSSRCEGFGINILQALAAGVPVVSTRAGGNMDFCNSTNCLLVDNEPALRWAPFIPPYNRAKWFAPNIHSLRQQLRTAYNDYDALKTAALEDSSAVREYWTWERSVDIMESRIKPEASPGTNINIKPGSGKPRKKS